MKAERTPGPLSIDANGNVYSGTKREAKAVFVEGFAHRLGGQNAEDQANTKFIVKSWNAHDALVAENESLKKSEETLLLDLADDQKIKTALVGIGKKIIKDADNSVDDDVDSSGWTKYVWVSRENLIALESVLREAGEEV